MWKSREDDAFHASKQFSARSMSLYFWGSSLSFPDWVLRTIEAEASAGQSIRIKSLDDIMRHTSCGPDDARDRLSMMFFDDTVANEVLANFGRLCEEVELRTCILAYRDPSIAQQLLNTRQTNPDLARILLLPMDVPISCWTPMLHLVLAGNFFVPGDLVCATERDPASRSGFPCSAGPENRLTRREEEVLALVAKGGRNKAIAHTMSLSEHTVKLHLHHAISKIGARNRTEAANWYLTRQHADRP